MCTTCNRNRFEKVSIEVGGRVTEKIEQSLGYGRLVIRCNPDGSNYVMAVKDEPKSEFRIYRCPTCGHKLFD